MATDPSRAPQLGAWTPWLIALLAVALYLGTLRYEFVWDDLALVLNNQFVRRLAALPTWLTLTAEQTSFGHFSGNLYRPGTLASLALDFAVWGDRPLGFHLTSILLNATMVLLVHRLVLTIAGRRDLAAVTTLLFAVHPVHVEAVAWVSARADLWVSIWIVAGVLFYHESLCRRGWTCTGFYCAALLSMGAGLLFKEAAVVLPLLLLLVEGLGQSIRALRSGPWSVTILRSLPFWAIAVAHLTLLSRPLQTYNPDPFGLEALLARLPGSLETLARYACLLIFPVGMRPFYDLARPTSLLGPWPLAGAGLLVALVGLGLYCRRRCPAAAFGLAWFLVTVAPYLDLLAFSPRTMGLADRYLYGPSLGFLLCVAVLLDRATTNLAKRDVVGQTRLLGFTTAVLVVAFSALTAWYMPVWRENLSLYSRMVRDFPGAPQPRLNLGAAYLDLGEVERGFVELETAVRLRPQWVRPQIALAYAAVAFRNSAGGFQLFDRIAPAARDEYYYYVMRGRAHLLAKQPEAAGAVLATGLQRFPASLELHFLLAHAREAGGDPAGAVAAYRSVLALDPRLASAYEGLGRTLAQQGDYAAAIRALRRALELQPERIATLRFLAMTLESAGQVEESLRLWREVATRAQDPDHLAEAQARLRSDPSAAQPRRP